MKFELALLSSQRIKAIHIQNHSNQFPRYGSREAVVKFLSGTVERSPVISLDDYMSKDVWSLSGAQTLKLLNSIITTFHTFTPIQAARMGCGVNNINRIFFNITDFTVSIFQNPDETMDCSDTLQTKLELLNLCQFILTKQMPAMQSLALPASSDLSEEMAINDGLKKIFAPEKLFEAGPNIVLKDFREFFKRHDYSPQECDNQEPKDDAYSQLPSGPILFQYGQAEPGYGKRDSLGDLWQRSRNNPL